MNDGVRKIQVVGGLAGPIWFIGWLFTIGFVHLTFIGGCFALLIWPYYLGAALRGGH